MTTHDPEAAAIPGEHPFGIPCTFDHASAVLLPVPFDATVSYGIGASLGPRAILEASAQIDVHDARFGDIYQRGIAMDPIPTDIEALSAEARALVEPIAEAGGAQPHHAPAVQRINAICEQVNARVRARAAEVLAAGKTPVVIGGEHSVSLGAIQAAADRFSKLGVLQIDAHMDLRRAYLGLHYSHASVILNAMETANLAALVQIGIRDFARSEARFADARAARVHRWDDLAESLAAGEPWRRRCQDMIQPLPEDIYLTWDIDGLDPALCPHTGTPVPGGLSWDHASILIDVISKSGRRVVAMDLVEVVPGPDNAPPIDAIVGARLLYRMLALVTPHARPT